MRIKRAGLGGAEGARRFEQARIEGLERRLGLTQVERAGDEGHRHDHAGGRQHERQPGIVQQTPHDAVGPSGCQQGDALGGRRQHQRKLDQRHERRLQAELARGLRSQAAGVPASTISASAIADVSRLSRSASTLARSPGLEIRSPGEVVDKERDERQPEEDQRQRERRREKRREEPWPRGGHPDTGRKPPWRAPPGLRRRVGRR